MTLKRENICWLLGCTLILISRHSAVIMAGETDKWSGRIGSVLKHDGGELIQAFSFSDGNIWLSKASALKGKEGGHWQIRKYSRKKAIKVQLIKTDRQNDLALLAGEDLDAMGLIRHIDHAEQKLRSLIASTRDRPLKVGQLLLSPLSEKHQTFGVLSQRMIAVPKLTPVLGLGLKVGYHEIQVSDVVEGGPAALGGLKENDIIQSINHERVADLADVKGIMSRQYAGESILLRIKRAGRRLQLNIQPWPQAEILSTRPVSSRTFNVSRNHQQAAAVTPERLLSQRRHGFEQVLQHDTQLSPQQCGGPLINTRGELVGMNIARAGRIKSYALPIGQIHASLVRMK